MHGSNVERLATLRRRIPGSASTGEDEPDAAKMAKPQRKCVGCRSQNKQNGNRLKRKTLAPPSHRS